ncbi:primosomal protein DnaI [Breznakia sp. PF5-3]|uniref:ATP-binding protein n=1 Tax=unclassified Breznakia TaxID=2623764 RepID=UPI002406A8D6|nr:MULTISPECIES: ATP-binding protein [unclassified Breznakia]MDF9823742.1 primosomal protein DnaI [Breznakia sp. PM6-1]MDF9834540.1 primosomal protein DnaI [Breznakia sp. PF5-3]
MKKIIFNAEINDELSKEKKALCKQLLLNQKIQKFLRTYKLSESFVYENTYLLNDYQKRISLCDDCAGLAYCKQEVNGYILSIQIQSNDVEKILVPCHYLQQLDSSIAHQNQLIFNHMSADQLQYRFSLIDIANETVENPSYARIATILKEYISKHDPKSFFICGKPGVGKTYLACCYINEVAKKGIKCGFVHVPTLIADLKTLMYDNAAFKKVIYNLRRVDVLILDDIGGESASTWSRDDILLPLLNDRMENRRKTLFTSNFNFDEIEEFYRLKSKAINDKIGANRLVERMKSLADEKVLKGNNRRVENSSN